MRRPDTDAKSIFSRKLWVGRGEASIKIVAAWASVDVDVSDLGDQAARINTTLPLRILRAFEAHVRKQGEIRSGSFARAVLDAIRKACASSKRCDGR
jgi:hypothetical protein